MVDVTEEAGSIFPQVEKAYLQVGAYVPASGDTLEEWKEDISKLADPDVSKRYINLDNDLFIKFQNGKEAHITVSEWGSISDSIDGKVF